MALRLTDTWLALAELAVLCGEVNMNTTLHDEMLIETADKQLTFLNTEKLTLAKTQGYILVLSFLVYLFI